MNDDLHAPLGGAGPPRPPRAALSRRSRTALGLSAAALAAAAFAFAPRDKFGGEPHAVARIEPYKAPEAAPAPPVAAAANEPAAAATDRDHLGVAEVEQLSGVKVTRSGGVSEQSGAHIIRIEPTSGVKLTPAPDRRVVEKGRFGPLPKIGADGARPMDVYARPFVTAPSVPADAPRIALVVGGVGLNASVSSAAIDQLPEGVTLAFAPYGADIDRLVAAARARGHEALLQAPMEPFDYPQNNPGAHTLLTAQSGGEPDDLLWLMSRFAGYAGVMNHLGGRYMADEAAMTPTLTEIAQRGLFFLDDGASPQSLAPTLAPKLSLPNARVDVILDARGTPQSLDAALAHLEALARQKGVAIGFANALPATIARIARFARDLERRGVALAPASSTLAPKAATAEAAGARR